MITGSRKLLPLLLLSVLATSLRAAQNSNQQAIDAEVQNFLDVPVWYLSWRVSLECTGSDGGTSSLRHVRSGTAELGIRSQGPALTTLRMDPARMRTPDGQQAFLDMIPKCANWTGGPHITDDMDQAEQDAAWTRVMEANRNAFARHVFSSEAPDSYTRMSGAGQIIDFADYQFEIDAVNRKYLFKLSSGYTDGAQDPTPVEGERVDNAGTEHEVRHPIDFGLEGGGTTMQIVSTAPEFDPIMEASLPASFGNISGSPSWAVVVRAHGKEMRGSLMVQYSLSPRPPEPVELIVIPPAELPNWRPIGDNDEKTRGDFVPVKVKLQKVGGGDPQYKAMRFVYRLKSSKERGVCMNWPPVPEADSPFDLQFEQELNAGYDIIGMDRQIAEQFGDKLTEGEVNVSCFDYGAYGELEVIAELDNYTTVHGVVQGTQSDRVLKLPLRRDDSLIALAVTSKLPGLKDDDDSENDPVGDGFLGDGLSLYEEYRGFEVGDNWTAGDPKKKDVFVLNQMRGMPQVLHGIKVFEKATGLKVHYELKDNQVNAAMNINFWATTGPHVVDQHVIRIQPGMTRQEAKDADEDYAAFVEKVGTPGSAKSVHMPPDLRVVQQAGNRRLPYFAITLAHEMLHSCNVFHHGEADDERKWVYVANPSPHIVERGAGGDTPITLKRENGSIIDPRRLFRDPANVSELDVAIGVSHGQHSGHETCLMRYDNAWAYVSQADAAVRYVVDEAVGLIVCVSADGTGVNAPGRAPQSRYGPAATAVNGGPWVKADRGNCKHQIRVNDKGQEPER